MQTTSSLLRSHYRTFASAWKRLFAEQGGDDIVVFSRPTRRLALIGSIVYAHGWLGSLLGLYFVNKGASDESLPTKKRTQLIVLGGFIAFALPGLTIPVWRIFIRRYGTKLTLKPMLKAVEIETMSFIPGRLTSTTFALERIEVLPPMPKTVLTTPALIFRKNNGDPKDLSNLVSYMFEKRPGSYMNDALFEQIATAKYVAPK